MDKINIVLYNQNIWGNYSPPDAIANRNELIRDLVFSYKADICCFQECNTKTSRAGKNAIDKLLAEQYVEVNVGGGLSGNQAPIFYKPNKYEVCESGLHIFTGINPFEEKSFTWCVFREKSSNILFGIISTHFWFKGPEDEHNLQRLKNAEELMAVVDYMKAKYNIPIFASGDFNCGKDMYSIAPITYIKQTMFEVREIAKQTTNLKTCRKPPIMNEKGLYDVEAYEGYMTIDYIFLSRKENVEVHSFDVDVSKTACNSSDHSPLIMKATIYA